MNKKGIRAVLYLPKECFTVIEDNSETFENYLLDNFKIAYDIYLGEYNEEEVCGFAIELFNNTFKDVENDYKRFKNYVKEITGKLPKQVFKLKFERI